MESPKRRPGRSRTGRSLDSLAVEKLHRAIWCGSRRSCMDHQKNLPYVEILKGRSLFNTDSDFAVHLLSLEMASRTAAPLVSLVRLFDLLAGLTKSGYGEKISYTGNKCSVFLEVQLVVTIALFMSTKTCVFLRSSVLRFRQV